MNLKPDQWIALLPILITSATIVVVMLAIAAHRHHRWNATLCVVGLNFALFSCAYVWLSGVAPQPVTPLLVIDHFSLFYMGLILATTLVCVTLSHAYMEGYQGNREEIYLLLALAGLGGLTLVCARHFASFFIGLELMSVPLYGMIAYPQGDRRALEGGIKYLVLSAVASAFILFGMALIYARTGTLDFAQMSPRLLQAQSLHDLLLLTGGALLLVGIGFKISVVPFHLWTPDVYQGAPAPVAAWLATASKTAVFALLLRFFVEAGAYRSPLFVNVLAALALLSMIVGNVLALLQNNLKRLLAYSSIAHFGYVLVAFVAGGPLAVEAVGIYLLTYVITTLAAFGVISLMSSPRGQEDAEDLFDFRGLFWRRPYLSAILTVALLSLAGIPLTAGFIGKFYVAAAGVDARLWILLGGLIAGSAIGLYYYLRAMAQLYLRQRWRQPFSAPLNWAMRAGGVVMVTLMALMLLLGVYPDPAINLIKAAGLTAPTALA
ncbi:MAG: NADH-quinone oxidoreductase subunit NuoN, partial [Gammaproteobacteria bacterium]|nr:NADH-quinone oxidoreductase subunit NuoN [Gammaproteobacteria bacterium]